MTLELNVFKGKDNTHSFFLFFIIFLSQSQ